MTAALLFVGIVAGYWAGRLAERRRQHAAESRRRIATVIEFPRKEERIPFRTLR